MRLRVAVALLFFLLPVSSFGAVEQTNCSTFVTTPAQTPVQTVAPPTTGPVQKGRISTALSRLRKPLMRFRSVQLKYTVDGFARTGRAMVAYDGCNYYVAGFADDPGLYFFVPPITRALNVGIETASTIFVFGAVFLSFVVGAVGLLRYTGKKWPLIPLSILLAMMLRFGDLYVFTAIPILALVPWFLLRIEKGKALLAFLISAGLIIGTSHLVRSFAGVSLLLFMIWVLLTRKRFAMIAVLCVATAIPLVGFRLFESNVQSFLSSRTDSVVYPAGHPFWHQIYIGLSFVSNPDVPGAYEDTIGIRRASEIKPGIVQYSPEYENVLRHELVRLVRTDPLTIGSVEFVKACVIFTFVVIFANRALLRKTRYTYPILVMVAFESLFGILTVPHPKYLLGLITWCLIYSVICLDSEPSLIPEFGENSTLETLKRHKKENEAVST